MTKKNFARTGARDTSTSTTTTHRPLLTGMYIYCMHRVLKNIAWRMFSLRCFYNMDGRESVCSKDTEGAYTTMRTQY